MSLGRWNSGVLPADRAEQEACALAGLMSAYELEDHLGAVQLYLAELLDEGLSGWQLRNRLRLIDVAAIRRGLPPPSSDRTVRTFLRGLYQLAPAGPLHERPPLYLEDVSAILDHLARQRLPQLRAQALLLLANATALPTASLRRLTWAELRLRKDHLVLQSETPSRHCRPGGTMRVEQDAFPLTVQTVRAFRRELGPRPGPVFALRPDGPTDAKWARQVVARLPGRGDKYRIQELAPTPEQDLARELRLLGHATPRQARDASLLTLAFAACLTGVEASALQCGDVERLPEGLLLHLPGRRMVTAVPEAEGRHCPVRYWEEWQGHLSRLGRGTPADPAFPGITGHEVLGASGMDLITLYNLVRSAATAAGLSGSFGFTSLRTGFIRSAIRAGVPDTLLLQQAGLQTLKAIHLHTSRERLISHSVAGRVGL